MVETPRLGVANADIESILQELFRYKPDGAADIDAFKDLKEADYAADMTARVPTNIDIPAVPAGCDDPDMAH